MQEITQFLEKDFRGSTPPDPTSVLAPAAHYDLLGPTLLICASHAPDTNDNLLFYLV